MECRQRTGYIQGFWSCSDLWLVKIKETWKQYGQAMDGEAHHDDWSGRTSVSSLSLPMDELSPLVLGKRPATDWRHT